MAVYGFPQRAHGAMMPNMNVPKPPIRSAEEGDAPVIAAIYEPYVRDTAVSFEIEPPTADIMRQRIATTLETHPWLVEEHDSEVVGFAYAGKHSERAGYRWTVDVTVYVNATRRQDFVGRALYGALLEVLRRQGFRSAFAEIVLPNPGSVRLHETAGFKPIGVHHDVGSSSEPGATLATGALVWPKVLRHLANPYRLRSFGKRRSSRAPFAKADESRAGSVAHMSVSIYAIALVNSLLPSASAGAAS
jgi:phosphinothricin acetyltransferase